MKRELSPLERSRQILREIERGESRSRTSDIKVPTPPPQQDPAYDEEGITMEGQPVRNVPVSVPTDEPSTNPLLKFDPQSIVQGFIFSEILGKPVSRRRGRW